LSSDRYSLELEPAVPGPTARHAYKDIRLQQLRGLCETARLGSLSAAAAAMGVSQPTVWEQVHALEREFGVQLIESHRRGCRLTEAGQALVDLASPVVAGADSLKQAFRERRALAAAQFVVAAPQRVLVEDLPHAVQAFRQHFPRVRLKLLERIAGQGALTVETGDADLGVVGSQEAGTRSARLHVEPAYELDSLLVTPPDHPLAKRRRVEPADLRGYPLVNAPEGFSRPEVSETLRKLGVFEMQPRNIEAVTSAVIRHYVAMGFGVGLVLGIPGVNRTPRLHERSMSRHFGRAGISLVWRRGAHLADAARAFIDLVKAAPKAN